MTATLDLVAARTAAWEAFDRRHDEHVASLQQFVRIPSARGEELAAQTWMARRMESLGLDVEMIECDPDALARYPTWSPTDWSYENRPNVAGRWPGTGGGRSLILNAHVDTTSPEPVELWSRDPWGGEIEGNRLYARGAQDDKAGCCEMLFVVQALQDAGLRLKGDLILETTIDEECSGNGSLALVAAGYEADGVLMLDGTGLGRAIVAHPGHVAFRVTIHGKPVPYISATHGVNAIEKASVVIGALRELEAKKNASVPPRWADTDHPIHFNVYGISGGEWVGTVAARCVLDATLGFMPPETVADARAEIEATVAAAAAQDEWLRDHPPQVTFQGLALEPLDMGDDNAVVAHLAEAHQVTTGLPLGPVAITGFCDLHQHSLRRPTPGCLFGPGGGGGAHSVDEFFDLNDLAPVTKTAIAFVLDWCGWEAA